LKRNPPRSNGCRQPYTVAEPSWGDQKHAEFTPGTVEIGDDLPICQAVFVMINSNYFMEIIGNH
jgi:hypothetical protein